MAGKNKAAKFEGMTDAQILEKAKALEDKFRDTPAKKRPQDFYDFGNKAVEINRMRRATREKARMSKENAFDTGLATTWGVPKDMETTRNRLAALIMQESGPRADAVPEYTMLGERLVASAIRNYMDKYGLTAPELISGKGRYGGSAYLTSINDVQKNPEQSVYDWANDKFNQDMFIHDDTTFNHMTNAVRLASALVNGTLRPLTTATNFKHLAPDEEFNGMTKVDYDFGATPVPANKVLKLYIDPKLKRSTRQDAKGGDTRSSNESGKAAETFDTPIPKKLKTRYDAWYAQLPKNLQYTGDYDLQGAWLEKLGQPDKYEAAQNGHLDDYGKKPNHITFSTGSKWHDPKVPERTGGEWKQAADGSWDFYPGTGNKASDDELKAYFDKYEKGNRVHGREVRQDAKGGDVGSGTAVPETPVSDAPAQRGGPRIVINPTTFRNSKDGLCVAFNEGFRIWMEATDFQPQSEPTDRQRKFFSDTAYADDEVQLRRTILARIATFDTSVKDPTDDQLAETGSFLDAILESDWCKNDWERNCVSRLSEAVKASVGAEPMEPRPEPIEPREPEPLQSRAELGNDETGPEA